MKTEWISVKDRLPDTDTWVMVCYDNGTQILPHWCRKNKWYCYDTSYNVTDKVTHWMPLPDPPKK